MNSAITSRHTTTAKKEREKKEREKNYNLYIIYVSHQEATEMAAMMSKRRPRHHGHHRPQFTPLIRTKSKLSIIVIIDILEPVLNKVSEKLVSLTTRRGINKRYKYI